MKNLSLQKHNCLQGFLQSFIDDCGTQYLVESRSKILIKYVELFCINPFMHRGGGALYALCFVDLYFKHLQASHTWKFLTFNADPHVKKNPEIYSPPLKELLRHQVQNNLDFFALRIFFWKYSKMKTLVLRPFLSHPQN